MSRENAHRRSRVPLLLLLLGLGAIDRSAVAGEPASLCRIQADRVEHRMGLPPGLLLAVGRVESGRRDPAGGDPLPWPWTVDDAGQDHVFNSAFDAIAYVVQARGRGSRSLDVGCFQVNLQFHPDAFATVAEAFDPAANARYAGALLRDLHMRSGSWDAAVRLYHSATPWRGAAYRDLVLSHWAETSLAPASRHAPDPPAGAPGRPVFMSIQYPTPPGAAAVPRRGRLPRVVVPSGDVGP